MKSKLKNSTIQQQLKFGLIVSCQPVEGGAMDSTSIITAMAKAAEDGGCHGLRIEGARNVESVANVVGVPIIGIIKRDLNDSPVRITPLLDDIDALSSAGAQIIAFDATARNRPVPIRKMIENIHSRGCMAMADISNFQEGINAHNLGCEFIGSTLSGYTSGEIPDEPDLTLVTQLNKAGCTVIAEGRYNTPILAEKAIDSGAYAVTVGSAITRVEHISGWFVSAIKRALTSQAGHKL